MIKAICTVTSYKNNELIQVIPVTGWLYPSGRFEGWDGLRLYLCKSKGTYTSTKEYTCKENTTRIEYVVKLSLVDKIKLLFKDIKSIPH